MTTVIKIVPRPVEPDELIVHMSTELQSTAVLNHPIRGVGGHSIKMLTGDYIVTVSNS